MREFAFLVQINYIDYWRKEKAMGELELFLGPMRSNKTGELIHFISIQRTYGHQNVLVIKPSTDTKSRPGLIETKGEENNLQMGAFEVSREDPWKILELLAAEEQRIGKKIDCLAIDEGQFFKQFFIFVSVLLCRGYNAVIAGLDRDFRGEPFGDMLNLIALTVENGRVNWCVACCTQCGQRATLSQRLINGTPAPYDSPVIMPGEFYEPRCENHFVLPGIPYPA